MAGMKAVVLGIVWALAGFCCVAADIPIQPNFDAAKFGGTWYPLQLVLDIEGLKDVKITGRKVTPLDNGDMDVDVEILENGECTKKLIRFLHTDQPGKFTTEAGTTIHVVDTDYDSYLFVHVDAGPQKILHFEARDPQGSDSLKEKFKKLAGSLGFPTDKIKDMPSTDPCSL
ncbi:epididymal secretory protein 4-like [Anolis carolinensis]|uniref:epididymal secretory protein 4-like n=1 Tax=Anolis carolinensis TaxID=28377 RepID=UPI002F2B35A9